MLPEEAQGSSAVLRYKVIEVLYLGISLLISI
jgi:hypothetical protein